ncbi:hypothetical protein BDM02DRAFT_1352343 [Thelephora ganbajun]|uniref:Uncharacterized protein n=1 Tax=Thelephora ganbajun TaxID=370292 RepID=A0ACB6ZM07_THEGA|nr:hypothetical protein BDM02DRAFT_1352343 [Thelephora ganbajun]
MILGWSNTACTHGSDDCLRRYSQTLTQRHFTTLPRSSLTGRVTLRIVDGRPLVFSAFPISRQILELPPRRLLYHQSHAVVRRTRPVDSNSHATIRTPWSSFGQLLLLILLSLIGCWGSLIRYTLPSTVTSGWDDGCRCPPHI